MKFNAFKEGRADIKLREIVDKVTQEINFLSNDVVLQAPEGALEDKYAAKVHIEPLVVRADESFYDKPGNVHMIQGTTPGTILHIYLPYTGDARLWHYSSFPYSSMFYPEIEDHHDTISFTVQFLDNDARGEQIDSQIKKTLSKIVEVVADLNKNVEQHNKYSILTIQKTLAQKRKTASTASAALQVLSIPMKHRDQPLTYTLPLQRRAQPIEKPAATAAQLPPNPVLAEKEYIFILSVLRSMSLVIERNPASFSSLKEEVIRDLFLMILNGHYEGSATGETFNAGGKTDILIKHDNNNVFIAECKFWKGETSFNKAIDQLLNYLTWRDAKCALLIFNKKRDSVAVREKMHATMTARSEYRKTLLHEVQGDARYVFIKTDTPGCEISITTQLYDVPSKIQEKELV